MLHLYWRLTRALTLQRSQIAALKALGFANGAIAWHYVKWGLVIAAAGALGGIVLGLQSLPSITWLPMAVLWFGLSEKSIIFVVLMGSTFSIAMAVSWGR